MSDFQSFDRSAKPEGKLILVQIRDAEGFWCNVYEEATVKAAIKRAESVAVTEQAETRVCTGHRREVVRVFNGQQTAQARREV